MGEKIGADPAPASPNKSVDNAASYEAGANPVAHVSEVAAAGEQSGDPQPFNKPEVEGVNFNRIDVSAGQANFGEVITPPSEEQ